MSTPTRSILGFLSSGAVVVFNLGWDMIGYQNPTLGYVLWGIAATLLIVGVWPWIKRWRPLTLAPAKDSARAIEAGQNTEVSKSSRRMPLVGGSARYPVLQDHELSGTHFKNRTIHFANFADEFRDFSWSTVVISGLTFEDCRIVGSVVVMPLNTGRVAGRTFIDCLWDEGSAAFWTGYDRMHVDYIGTIGLEDCVFRNCRFTRVGVLVSVAELHVIRGQPRDEQSELPSELGEGD